MHADIVGFLQIEPIPFIQYYLVSDLINRAMSFDFYYSDAEFSHVKDSYHYAIF
ncbi:conserved hypothetical protein [delta proteobacterium NaphS2]|nr:conserved hypothetical protein [delta proteobacterium NaphS2]